MNEWLPIFGLLVQIGILLVLFNIFEWVRRYTEETRLLKEEVVLQNRRQMQPLVEISVKHKEKKDKKEKDKKDKEKAELKLTLKNHGATARNVRIEPVTAESAGIRFSPDVFPFLGAGEKEKIKAEILSPGSPPDFLSEAGDSAAFEVRVLYEDVAGNTYETILAVGAQEHRVVRMGPVAVFSTAPSPGSAGIRMLQPGLTSAVDNLLGWTSSR